MASRDSGFVLCGAGSLAYPDGRVLYVGWWPAAPSFGGTRAIRFVDRVFFCDSNALLRVGGRVRGALRLLEHERFVLWCWCSSLFCRFKCASTCVEWGREGHSVVGTRAMVRGCQRAQRGMFCVEGGGAKAVRLLEHDGFVLCSWRSSSNRSDSFCAVGVLLLFGDSNALLRV